MRAWRASPRTAESAASMPGASSASPDHHGHRSRSGRSEINAVVIATRHDSHAELVCRAAAREQACLRRKAAGTYPRGSFRHRGCEAARSPRRASRPSSWSVSTGASPPRCGRSRTCSKAVPAPKSFVMTVNAGAIPADHWTQDRENGGGRIVGEACHFIDLLRFLAGAPIRCISCSGDGGGDWATRPP